MTNADIIEKSDILREYLVNYIPDFSSSISLEKFDGGQSNPTYKVTCGEKSFVLRKQPPGKLLKSAHAVDREFKVLEALYHSNVPVAKPYHLCTDTNIIGEMFYLMEYCDGDIYWDAALKTISSNDQRTAMYDNMNQALANIHRVDVNKVGLSDYGKPGNYFQRQLNRWIEQYKASELKPIPEMDTLYQWLEKNQPNDDGQIALVHGDYRLDNLIFKKGTSEIQAVLDWELSTLGHPYSDLAYQCMQLRLPEGMGKIDGLGNKNRHQFGIPTEREYVSQYCQRMNIERIDNWSFYLAFSFFRLAAICQGVAKRATQGNASNKNAAQVGSFVKPLAQMAHHAINE
ncbi:phosphotransferase family protein [Thalassotalea sp. M1531]|uniref:Phosphotransferase family protein n=1 Tax=Thalassotalea algicola TaxID=2716224 RepID=A0A7Y0LBY4_9GAMM|nr:phosphotransferase family protein [Thalassotalea algicola]NMP31616.1 phosphotransferase family protein [Thalassotalea algicola]